jgi:hypothetical protein
MEDHPETFPNLLKEREREREIFFHFFPVLLFKEEIERTF